MADGRHPTADPNPTPAPPPAGGGRRAAALLAGAAMVVAAVLLTAFLLRGGDEEPARFEHTFPSDYIGTVWITVTADDGGEHTVELEWARLTTTVPHEGTRTYFFVRGVGQERDLPLEVTVDPPAEVTFGYGDQPPDGVDIGATPWDVLPWNEGTAPNRPANADTRTATATVNETSSYGGPPIDDGVGVRARPLLDEPAFARIKHGVELTTDCWVEGQRITNGNDADPSDDGATYTTTVWWRVTVEGQVGFITDAWFSRAGNDDKLNLPNCDTLS
ncbi:MAG: hypothetical protein R2749_02690 [Acidimicrobiales bacterium]